MRVFSSSGRASLGLQRTVVAVEAVHALVGFGLAAWILFDYLVQGGEAGSVLLLVYWALYLPILGQEMSLLIRQYPIYRNVTLRLLEPLGAHEETAATANLQVTSAPITATVAMPSRGIAIALQGVSVRVAGHTIPEGLDLAIQAGSHIAIVGPSGAGQSSLVGLLLGWYRPSTPRPCAGACAASSSAPPRCWSSLTPKRPAGAAGHPCSLSWSG